MKGFMNTLSRAALCFLIFTIVCGGGYTLLVTGLAQLFFNDQANGSLIEVDGTLYGSELMGQQFQEEDHMWGRIVNLDVSTYQDQDGEVLMYGMPSNLSPASEEYGILIEERAAMIKAAHPEQGDALIPVDLVTGSGSGLDPHISVSAAEYQVERLARANQMDADDVRNIIKECTEKKLLGVFGEKVVNVLKVNLMLEGIL